MLRCESFSLRWLLLLQSTRSRAEAQQLRHTGLVALKHAGSSSTRDGTHVPCTGRWILIHCATGDVSPFFLSFFEKYVFTYLAVLGLSCGMWDSVPWIEPRPPTLGAQSLNYWITSKVPLISFYMCIILNCDLSLINVCYYKY